MAKSLSDLPHVVAKDLKRWQLFTLASKEEVLGLFLDSLENGNPDTGECFPSISAAFFQTLRMCGYHHRKLRLSYERFVERQRAAATDPGDPES